MSFRDYNSIDEWLFKDQEFNDAYYNPPIPWDDDYESIIDYNRSIPLDPDYHFDYEMGCNHNVDLKHINQDKLAKFNTGNNTYRWFDKEFAHWRVAYKSAWYDPIHTYANNHGFKIAVNNIQRLVKKNVGRRVSTVIWKLKNHPKYKCEWTFRSYADSFIESLLEKNNIWYDYLEDIGLKIEKGYLRKKDES